MQIIGLGLLIAPAVHAQISPAAPPRQLDGAWELVAVDGQSLPLRPRRDDGDPAECGRHGEFVGTRIGEGRLVVRIHEMLVGPWSERWEGGAYGYFPEDIICRATGGATIVLRRDEHNKAVAAVEGRPRWRARGSYGVQGSTASLSVGDHNWTITSAGAPNGGTLNLEDLEGRTWTFRRAAPGPKFDPVGYVTLLGDFDGDREYDQVSITPEDRISSRMLARLSSGAIAGVIEIPAYAHTALAPRGFHWRNADGAQLQLEDRDAVLVSVEPAPGRSDVTIYFIRNGEWTAWAYAPD